MVTTLGPTHAVGGQESANVVSGPQASVKYAVEAIGTFFLVFTVGTAAGSGSLSPHWESVRSSW
jgi:aquaporin Z